MRDGARDVAAGELVLLAYVDQQQLVSGEALLDRISIEIDHRHRHGFRDPHRATRRSACRVEL